MPSFYNDIHGWFSFPAFYTHVFQQFPEGSHFVEVGSWCGKSACFMAELIKESGKKIKFDCVDTWLGTQNEAAHADLIADFGGDLYKVFLDNMEKAGVKDIVNPIRSDSLNACYNYERQSLDFVFIDADHENCFQDAARWYSRVKVGGIIAGHDITHPPVRHDVEDFFGHGNYEDSPEDVWFHIKTREDTKWK